jgi:hypothetical protein
VSADPAREADAYLLRRRLADAGLRAAVLVHENRRVVVHVRKGRVRVHRGFAYAPDRVLRALVTFAAARSRAARRAAGRELATFPVHDYVPAPSAPQPEERSAADTALVRRLEARHATLNARHFDGGLSLPAFRISHRMRRRLGEIVVPPAGGCTVVISRRHVDRDGWEEVEHTLLHEMIHQWQLEHGYRLDHGPRFRSKARQLGVAPAARRAIPAGPRHAQQGRIHGV